MLISFIHTLSSPLLTCLGACVCFTLNVVLLGVVEKQLQNEVFQAEMERKLAQLLSEVSTRRRMWRRATITAGNNMVQVRRPEEEGGEGESSHLKMGHVFTQMENARRKVLINRLIALLSSSECVRISVPLESGQIFPESLISGQCSKWPCGDHSKRMYKWIAIG